MRTELETQQRNRLRLACAFFRGLKVTDAQLKPGGSNTNYLPPRMVTKIARWLTANGVSCGDLVALRICPGKFDQRCYAWLWILHRYLNAYAY